MQDNLKEDNWQDLLKTLLNCDIKELYPLARTMDRELEFYVGPTNSGKTYSAMKKLKESNSGVYLAPLRLLALEGYEDLKKSNKNVSLVTGEEERIDEDATCVCSTIEMLDFQMDVDVAVIDEVQMLADEERGWAWVNAIIGCPAKKVIMTGSVNALSAIRKIAEYLNEPLKISKFKRKNDLIVNKKATSLRDLESGTALIAFSRRNVLKLKQKLQKQYKLSVIYGNLSPEVRREEARRFRNKESSILIATDAIAMGLNLPIKTVLFTDCVKFDGKSSRGLEPNEIVQIAGRAGRFGHFEAGFLGATDYHVLKYIKETFLIPIKTIKGPFGVKINNFQLESLSEHLKTKSLVKILKYFSKNMSYIGPFKAANIDSILEVAKFIEFRKNLSLENKYILAQAPISLRSAIITQAFESYCVNISKNKECKYKPSITIPKEINQENLIKIEDEVKKITLYLWLSYKFSDLFVDVKKANDLRNAFNSAIANYLKKITKTDRNKRNYTKTDRSRRNFGRVNNKNR